MEDSKKSPFSQLLEDLDVYWRKIGYPGQVRRHQPLHEDAVYPAIVGKMMNRVPAKNGVSPQGTKFFQPEPHPTRPGEFLQTGIREFDMIVEFQIHALTADEADRLTDGLEQLLEEDEGLFVKGSQVKRIKFVEQNEDEVLTKTSTESIAVRSLRYMVRYVQERKQVVSDMQRAKVLGSIR